VDVIAAARRATLEAATPEGRRIALALYWAALKEFREKAINAFPEEMRAGLREYMSLSFEHELSELLDGNPPDAIPQ
jgi:hypothetical protein